MANWANTAEMLEMREYLPLRNREYFENASETTYMNGKRRVVDIPMPANVSSTISIAMSHDGQMLASSHGDHTVKVFTYYNFKQIRQFTGHPRTPWTVKFHPCDSDILASGCLGCQVMIWSIKANKCLNRIRLDFSIISISFHPEGNMVAVASGTKLELWDWTAPTRTREQTTAAAPPINHLRNIRAVTFHPNGDYLFAAAPDAPRADSEMITYCSLFAIQVASWLKTNEAFVPANLERTLYLTAHPVILPQIHLYSDGGMDISRDGRFLFTCSRLFFPPSSSSSRSETTHVTFMGKSPLSTSERSDMEDEQSNRRFEDPSRIPAREYHIAQLANFPHPSLMFPTSPVEDLTIKPRLDQSIYSETLLEKKETFKSPMQRLFEAKHPSPFLDDGQHISSVNALATPQPPSVMISPFRSTQPFVFNLFQTRQQHSTMPRGHRKPVDAVSLNRRHPAQRDVEWDPQSNATAQIFVHDAHRNGCMMGTGMGIILSEGWVAKDHLCIFELHFGSDRRNSSNATVHHLDKANDWSSIAGDTRQPQQPQQLDHRPVGSSSLVPAILPPTLVNAKLLEGPLMRAITSVKLSPTSRHLLLGFGVRHNGQVQGHVHSMAACEVLSLQDPALAPVLVIEDFEDEVNIAQFHPVAAQGLVYGTKRGRTRVFVRA